MSSDISVSAQVQNVEPSNNQGGIIPTFFLQGNALPQQIGLLKEAKLIFKGKTSPGAFVLVKFIQADAEFGVFANNKGDFYVASSTLLNNVYDISIQATDVFGKKSNVYNFTFEIVPGENKKEDIFLAPTITLEKSEIEQDDILNIKGATYPFSSVIININSLDNLTSRQFFLKSNDLGYWEAKIKTSDFPSATYLLFAFAQSQDGKISFKSNNLIFRVLKKTLKAPKEMAMTETFSKISQGSGIVSDAQVMSKSIKKVDLNQDKKVGLKDLSILLANWGSSFKNPSVDFNQDKKVDLKDLSILMFYWTR